MKPEITRKCRNCNEEFKTKYPKKVYCSKNCQVNFWARNLRRKNPEFRIRERKAQKKRHIKLKALWRPDGVLPSGPFDDRVIQSEIFVANEVLPKHGFTDILLTRTFHAFFPCDILAKKDGKICGIEVTMDTLRRTSPKFKAMANYFDMRMFVCHVKPDFQWYYLREVTDRNCSSCIGVFVKSMEVRT